MLSVNSIIKLGKKRYFYDNKKITFPSLLKSKMIRMINIIK